jgi:hypothetical protein
MKLFTHSIYFIICLVNAVLLMNKHPLEGHDVVFILMFLIGTPLFWSQVFHELYGQ